VDGPVINYDPRGSSSSSYSPSFVILFSKTSIFGGTGLVYKIGTYLKALGYILFDTIINYLDRSRI